MYLTRLLLNPRDKRVWRDLGAPQELHRTLMRGFPAEPKPLEDFRLKHGVLHRAEEDPETRGPAVLVQSVSLPDWTPLEALAGYLAAPPLVRTLPSWEEVLVPGRELRFRLRANPTRKVETKTGPDGKRRHGRRVAVRGESAQLDWLARKAGQHGFEIAAAAASPGALLAVTTIENDLPGPGAKGGPKAVLASVLFEGRLRVTDPVRMAEAVRSGIGGAKAYGFGLLSLAAG